MKSIRTEIKWALIFSAAGLLWMVLEKFLGWHDQHIDQHMYLTNIFIIPAFVIYFFALKEKRDKDYQGVMSWKQGFVSGLIISVIVTLLTPLTQYITSEWITPEYFTNVIAYTTEHNMMTEEEALAQFNLKNYIVQGMLFAPVAGIMTSGIVAFFVRSKKKLAL